MDRKISQIRVGRRLTGIPGLEEILAAAADECAGAGDDEIAAMLLARVEAETYIPAPARDGYARALLREFKRRLGQAVEEEPPAGVQVKILGSGCERCDTLEREVREAMNALRLAGELVHVTGVREIARYGVMGVPALVINGRVAWAGSVPPRKTIEELLAQAASGQGPDPQDNALDKG